MDPDQLAAFEAAKKKAKEARDRWDLKYASAENATNAFARQPTTDGSDRAAVANTDLLTMFETLLARYFKVVEACTVMADREQWQQKIHALQAQHSQACLKHAEAEGAYEAQKKQEENEAIQLQIEADRAKAETLRAEAAANPPPRPPAPLPQTQVQQSVDTSTVPERLSFDATPLEFDRWKQDLLDYFINNSYENRDPAAQLAKVRAYVDLDVYNHLDSYANNTIPPFDSNGAVDTLREAFKIKYPLFARRMDWARFASKDGEGLMMWLARLKTTWNYADAGKMTSDQRMVFKAIASCPHPKLQDKLTEKEAHNYTFAQLKTAVLEFEATLHKKESIKSGGTAAINKVTGEKSKKKKKSSGASEGKYLTWDDMKDKCLCCGSSKHKKDACPKLKGALCSKCKGQGHHANACLSIYNSKKKENQQRGRSPTRDGDTAAARKISGDRSTEDERHQE